MPGKGGAAGGKNVKGLKKGKKDNAITPANLPEPSLLITNEQLSDKNWYPVIGIVVENSPVESLLVDLMMDCVEGNSFIVIKKDDVIQEAENLLKIQKKIYSSDETLSRRELEKREKAFAHEEQQKEKEKKRLDKEREDHITDEHLMKPGKRGKSAMKKVSKNSPAIANNDKVEIPQGQPASALQPPPSATPARRPRSLVDDLFEELQYFNETKSLEEVLKKPSTESLAILVKFKLLQVKRYDRQVFDSVRNARELDGGSSKAIDTDHLQLTTKLNIPVPLKDTKVKDSKAPSPQKVDKLAAPAGSIAKDKLPGGHATGRAKAPLGEEETNGPPVIGKDEVIVETAPFQFLGKEQKQGKKRARARTWFEIPKSIAELRQKLTNGSNSDEQLPAYTSDISCLEIEEGERDSKPRVELLMGDVYGSNRNTTTVERTRLIDKHEEIVVDDERMRGLLLASIVGTDGLPLLDHALTTKLMKYGLPTFPTSRNQMVRYIILQGFTDSAMLDEMARQKALITCLFKIQFLRHQNVPPLQLRNLLWVRRPTEQTVTLQKFWMDIDRAFKPSAAASELCLLALQIKFDITEHTTRAEFQLTAKETSTKLVDLFFQLVKAKTFFQIYKERLFLQNLPKFHKNPLKEKIDRPEVHDAFDYTNDLMRRGENLRSMNVLNENDQHDMTENELPVVHQNTISPVVQDFLKNLETILVQRGILPGLRNKQKITSPLFDCQQTLHQKPKTIQQIRSFLNYLGLDLQNLPSSTNNSSEKKILKRVLKKEYTRQVYNKNLIEKIYQTISESVYKNQVEFVKNEQNSNSLAEAMSAWKTSTKVKKRPQSQEKIHEFQIPEIFSDFERTLPCHTSSTDPNLTFLAKMRNYFAVVKYTPKQLLDQLSVADDHFFHHKIQFDEISGNVIIIFFALHEKNSHAFVRHSITRLPSRADFPTFVCNVMENVQGRADDNLNRAYQCPHQTKISPKFPYGCQEQIAYQRNCASLLSSPQVDHFQGFIRRYSLKNLVRNQKETFAKRCNWKNQKKSVQDLDNLPKAKTSLTESHGAQITPGVSPVLQTETTSQQNATKNPPFIWNRANDPLPPPCTVESAQKTISGYSLTNVLTKIVRHEERIYCPDSIISVDTSESYDEKTSVHVTATMMEGLAIFMSQDECGRTLSLELDNKSRFCFEKSAIGFKLSLIDARNVQIKLDSNSTIFCEMVVPQKPDHTLTYSEKPSTLFFTRNGHLHQMLPNARVKTIFSNGRTLSHYLKIPDQEPNVASVSDLVSTEQEFKPDSDNKSKSRNKTISGPLNDPSDSDPPIEIIQTLLPSPTEPILTLEEEPKPDPAVASAKLSLYHIETNTLAVHITRTGLQKSVQKLPNGFLRRVQVSPELRITTRKVTESTDETSKRGECILMEQPGLPRVGINTANKVNYISMQEGILLVAGEQMQCFLIVGTNAIMITSDGLLFVSQLHTFGDLFGVRGLQGLRGFASPDLINTAHFLLSAVQKNSNWQKNDSFTKFALTGDILCSVQDLSRLYHDILQNGEVEHQVWQDGKDRCLMPNPRVFVLDPADHSGSEYLFAEEALTLKYKLLHFYPQDQTRYNVKKTTQSKHRKKPRIFSCRFSDEPVADWKYVEAEVLPASMVSDLKGNTDYRTSDGAIPRERKFRAPNRSNFEQKEFWKKVLFIEERQHSLVAKKQHSSSKLKLSADTIYGSDFR